MTIDEMFNELEDKARDTYIVTLKYKYDFEEKYTIENHILKYESITDSYVWLNDWNEGQTDIEVLGYMLLGDVDTTKLLSCKDCVSRESLDNAISDLTYWHFENDRLITGGGGSKAETVYKVDDVWRLTHVLPSVTPSYNSIKTELKPCDTPRTNLAETSQDCVSRQALIDKATSWDAHFADSERAVSLADIMSLPSVTPQPKVGHWIPIHPLQEDDEGAYMCSCCRVGNWGIDPKVDKYCFNCGARMNGGGEDGRNSTN